MLCFESHAQPKLPAERRRPRHQGADRVRLDLGHLGCASVGEKCQLALRDVGMAQHDRARIGDLAIGGGQHLRAPGMQWIMRRRGQFAP